MVSNNISSDKSREICSRIGFLVLGIFCLFLLVIFYQFLGSKDSSVIMLRQCIALLRVPIISALLFFLLPILGIIPGVSNLLKNLFVIEGLRQLIALMVLTTSTAIIIVSSFEFVLSNSPSRFQIPGISTESLSQANIVLVNWGLSLFNWFSQHIIINFELIFLAFLLFPTFAITIILSVADNDNSWKTILAAFVGFVLSILLVALNAVLSIFNIPVGCISNFFKQIKQLILGNNSGFLGLIIDSKLLLLIICFIGVYIILFIFFNPYKLPKKQKASSSLTQLDEAPALLYILLLNGLLTGIFSLVTFFADYWHIPIVLAVIGFSGSMYLLLSTDYYFELKKFSQTAIDGNKKDDLKKIIEARLQSQDKMQNGRTLVVIATSGGGIQASGWTAQVLCGLQEELGPSFTQSISLISSVSGGSVGTMFFLDQFNETNGCPDQEKIENTQNNGGDIIYNATANWLNSVAWGIAYPDLWKVFWGNPIEVLKNRFDNHPKYSDRGYSLEWDWKRYLNTPEATLGNWRTKVLDGQIPIPIFNATLVEDGRRFLISPIKLNDKTLGNLTAEPPSILDDPKALDFHTLYNGYDLEITTAARLSASFPYVSPIARNESKTSLTHNYHVADGGFFDNAGLFTAIEWLDNHLESLSKNVNVKRVLLIQIDAIPAEKLKSKEKGSPGWFAQIIGPLLTLNSIRNSTQLARNARELKLFREQRLFQTNSINGVEVKTFYIGFPDNNKYDPPLSWKLTKKQINDLKDAWGDVKKETSVRELKTLWTETWKIPKDYNNTQS
ncbi:MAG TPA: hypothetical protein DCF68_06485 [Cyanothece sp. UBA12306]|nr:hypothetical protein [Cyanothece sp. UBA12306]